MDTIVNTIGSVNNDFNNTVTTNNLGIGAYFTNSQRTPTTQWMYNKLFPDIPFIGTSFIELEIGVEVEYLDRLNEIGFTSIYEDYDIINDENGDAQKDWVTKMYSHPAGYLIKFDIAEEKLVESSTKYSSIKSILKKLNESAAKKQKKSIYLADDVEIYFPGPTYRDNEQEHETIMNNIWNVISKNEIKQKSKRNKETAEIHILVKDQFDTYFKPFDVTRFAPELKTPDVFYGPGFSEFNQNLIDRVEKNKKGLVLLHGDPGTGKTHYIRYLLKILTGKNKRIIFIPSMLIEEMSNPETINFLIDDIINSNKDTILLMEDAEALLESRKLKGGRSVGISNLLNSTDGILNDLLGVVVVATFNTELENIDEALLRNGRLIARKNFKVNDYEASVRIAEELGIMDEFIKNADKTKLYSIADIINVNIENHTIIHDTAKKTSIGFRK